MVVADQYGAVRVLRGFHKGRVGYYDDSVSGEDEGPTGALVYFIDPCLSGERIFDFEDLEPLSSAQVTDYYEKARRVLLLQAERAVEFEEGAHQASLETLQEKRKTPVRGYGWVKENYPILKWLISGGHGTKASYERFMVETSELQTGIDRVLPWAHDAEQGHTSEGGTAGFV